MNWYLYIIIIASVAIIGYGLKKGKIKAIIGGAFGVLSGLLAHYKTKSDKQKKEIKEAKNTLDKQQSIIKVAEGKKEEVKEAVDNLKDEKKEREQEYEKAENKIHAYNNLIHDYYSKL